MVNKLFLMLLLVFLNIKVVLCEEYKTDELSNLDKGKNFESKLLTLKRESSKGFLDLEKQLSSHQKDSWSLLSMLRDQNHEEVYNEVLNHQNQNLVDQEKALFLYQNYIQVEHDLCSEYLKEVIKNSLISEKIYFLRYDELNKSFFNSFS